MEVTAEDLIRILGEKTIETWGLRRQIAMLSQEVERLQGECLRMSQQIGADHGEPT